MIGPSTIIPHQLLVKQVNMLSWLILGSKLLMKCGQPKPPDGRAT
jgi:hypothetical protein